MKKAIVTGLLILVFFLLETTWLEELHFISITPNLLLFLTFVAGFTGGRKTGLLTGFFCGILIDIFSEQVLGFNAIIYMYIGFLNGCFQSLFYVDDIKLPLILLFASEILYGFYSYVFLFLLHRRLNIGDYFLYPVIPELVYTLVAAVLLYRPLLKMYHWLEKGSVRPGD